MNLKGEKSLSSTETILNYTRWFENIRTKVDKEGPQRYVGLSAATDEEVAKETKHAL